MTYLTDWNAIAATDEYQEDLEVVTRIILKGVGKQLAYNSDTTFLMLVAHLATLKRYAIRHLVDLVDIDQTPKLDLLQQEIGFDLPITDAVPLVELLRESTSWFRHKGTKALIYYIGDLINSPITVNYPNQLIMKSSGGRGKLSGKISSVGELPFATTGRGHLRDGYFWANYTYQVVIEQAQDVINITDVYNLLFAVHPAGMKMFIVFNSNYIEDAYVMDPDDELLSEDWEEGYLSSASWATLDNGFKLSSGTGKLSMHGGNYALTGFDFVETTELLEDSDINRLSNDLLTHDFPTGQPWIATSRYVSNGDGTYKKVYSDTDAIVYENVTTNMGLFSYSISYFLGLTFRDYQNMSMVNDQKNMTSEMWLQDTLDATID